VPDHRRDPPKIVIGIEFYFLEQFFSNETGVPSFFMNRSTE